MNVSNFGRRAMCSEQKLYCNWVVKIERIHTKYIYIYDAGAEPYSKSIFLGIIVVVVVGVPKHFSSPALVGRTARSVRAEPCKAPAPICRLCTGTVFR